MEKKLVLPGNHLSSAEEAESGQNTYSEKDEIYSTAVGEDVSSPGHAAVKSQGRTLKQPNIGMPVYCVVTKASLNKAVAGCIPAEEAEGGTRGVEVEAVLPVTAIRRGYVRDIRDEVKIGDIIKARIEKITKTGVDISIFSSDCGVVCAFCPRCRSRMDIKERIFICSCGWKERRKLPLAEGEQPPEEDAPRRYREERGGRERGYYGESSGGRYERRVGSREESHGYGQRDGGYGYNRRPPRRRDTRY